MNPNAIENRLTLQKLALPWLGVAATLVLFLLLVAHAHPTRWFGAFRDDGLYFSSAKALAEGRGYVIANLPGNPPQTKYPILYPWILSCIWKCNPSFPANLTWAVCLSAAFSCAFLIVAFLLLRQFRGVSDRTALVILVVCATLPDLVTVGGSVLSDSLFMLLAMAAMVVADRALRAGGRIPWAVWAGILAGLTTMARSVGVAVVAGIVLAGLYRRALRQTVAACCGAALFLVSALWVGVGSHSGAVVAPAAHWPPGWQQTYAYYTSYIGMWKLGVPNLRVFLSTVGGNLGAIIETPAWYWLHPTLSTGSGFAATALGTPLTLLGVVGIVRQARADEWKPIHFVLAPTLLILLLWNYPVTYRFLLLFVPLFCLGFWVEAKHLAAVLRRALRSGGIAERMLAGLISAAFLALAGIALWNMWQFYRPHPWAELQAARLRRDKAQAYDWIRKNTLPADRIIACEDGPVYLFTGRQTVMPMAFSSEHSYTHNPRILARDLDDMADTAAAIRAHYWLSSPDDFTTDDERAQPARTREAAIVAAWPEVFRSPDGWVRVYDISGAGQSRVDPE